MINEQILERKGGKIVSLLWVEWTAFFILIPFVLRVWWKPSLMFLVLLVSTISVFVWLMYRHKFDYRQLWCGSVRGEWEQLKRILLRFAICGSMITALVLFVFPHNFLDLPLEKPRLWSTIMILYPVLSVYPQELIYRAFFFERYSRLFPNQIWLVITNALVFGLIHIIFQNPWAVLLTVIGGFFFAETYARTSSLRLVWLEHALYGCLIFTIGLGSFFYHARVPTS